MGSRGFRGKRGPRKTLAVGLTEGSAVKFVSLACPVRGCAMGPPVGTTGSEKGPMVGRAESDRGHGLFEPLSSRWRASVQQR